MAENKRGAAFPRALTRTPAALAVAALLAVAAPALQAAEFDTGNPDLKFRWDNTFKYSTAIRLKNPDRALLGGPNYDASAPTYFPNTDDGDRNFKRGIISNRLDWLTEADASWRNLGLRVSAAAWYDTVYRGHNDNDSPSTANPVSVPYNEFTAGTRKLMGRDAEILDAFVWGKFDVAGKPVALKLGKHTVLYGETLFMGFNGIAAAQAGIDVVKAMAVPNSQFKEFMRPVNQVSGQVQITPEVTLGGYYLLDRATDRLPAAGSYFSIVDLIADGAERVIVGNSPAGNVSLYRDPDMKAKKGGQGGVQARFHVGDVDYGLYAVRWNDRGPSGLYLQPFTASPPIVSSSGLQVGTYRWVYHEGIRAFGGSFSTTVGNVNLSGEASFRSNTPLASDPVLNFVNGNNSDNVLYPVGKSAHANLNWIASMGPSFISREADFVGEVGWNRRLSVTKNASALNPNATRDAANVRMIYEPKYRQVMSGLDLSVPVGIGYGISGNSSVSPAFLGRHTGDFSVGLSGTYLGVWYFGLNVTHYFGPVGQAIEGSHGTFKQALADRDFLSMYLRRSF